MYERRAAAGVTEKKEDDEEEGDYCLESTRWRRGVACENITCIIITPAKDHCKFSMLFLLLCHQTVLLLLPLFHLLWFARS
jgi:hypothetical protein